MRSGAGAHSERSGSDPSTLVPIPRLGMVRRAAAGGGKARAVGGGR